MSAIAAKLAGNGSASDGTPPAGSVDVGTLAPDVVALIDSKLAAVVILRSYLAADKVYNNVDVLANTLLSVTVEAGAKYDVELTVNSTNVARSLNLDFGGTATFNNCIGNWASWTTGASLTLVAANTLQITSPATDYTDINLDGLGQPSVYTFKGSIDVNVGGTFLLRGAQNVANPSDTIILKGATLMLTKC